MKKLLAVLFAMAMVFSFAACSDDDTGSSWPTVTAPDAGNLKIALWLNGSDDPGANSVFLVGAVAGLTNATSGLDLLDWGYADEANAMTKVTNGLYTIELETPTASWTGAIAHKFANVDGATMNNTWYGETAHGNYTLTVADGVIASWTCDAAYTRSQHAIVNNGSTVIIDLKSLEGWFIHAAGNITVPVTLTITWSGVPASHNNNGNIWENTADGTAVVAGALTNFLGNNYVAQPNGWDPANCLPVAVTGSTGTVTLTLPVGTPRAFSYKMARNTGWDTGEEAANQGAALAAAVGTQTITPTFKVYVP